MVGESVCLCMCVYQVVGSTGRCLLLRWQMQLHCAAAVCACAQQVCVLLHLDTSGECSSTEANSRPVSLPGI